VSISWAVFDEVRRKVFERWVRILILLNGSPEIVLEQISLYNVGIVIRHMITIFQHVKSAS
jgi:hypothetical protein